MPPATLRLSQTKATPGPDRLDVKHLSTKPAYCRSTLAATKKDSKQIAAHSLATDLTQARIRPKNSPHQTDHCLRPPTPSTHPLPPPTHSLHPPIPSAQPLHTPNHSPRPTTPPGQLFPVSHHFRRPTTAARALYVTRIPLLNNSQCPSSAAGPTARGAHPLASANLSPPPTTVKTLGTGCRGPAACAHLDGTWRGRLHCTCRLRLRLTPSCVHCRERAYLGCPSRLSDVGGDFGER